MHTIRFEHITYDDIPHVQRADLYQLRKITFKDRMKWKVNVFGQYEFDQFDNHDTVYLVGRMGEQLLCSVRFIPTEKPYMLDGPFRDFFNHPRVAKPAIVESSRFFVDKERARMLPKQSPQPSLFLFLAMINYGINENLESIITVVSKAMHRILKNSGWNFDVMEIGASEKNDPVYLLNLKIDGDSQKKLYDKILSTSLTQGSTLDKWPMEIVLNPEDSEIMSAKKSTEAQYSC